MSQFLKKSTEPALVKQPARAVQKYIAFVILHDHARSVIEANHQPLPWEHPTPSKKCAHFTVSLLAVNGNCANLPAYIDIRIVKKKLNLNPLNARKLRAFRRGASTVAKKQQVTRF